MTLTLQQLFSMDQYKMSAMIKDAVIWILDPKPIIMDEDYLQRVMKANPDTYYVKRLAQQNIMQKSIHYTVGCYGEDEHILKWYVIPKSTLRCLIPEKMYKISDLLKSNKEGGGIMNTQISLTPYDILTQWKYCGKIPDIIYYKGKQYDNCHKFFYEWFKDWKDVVKFVNMDLCEIDYPILSDHEKRIIHEDIRYAREQGYEPYALLKRIYLQQDNTYTYASDLVYMEKPNSNFNFVDSNLRPVDMDSLIPNVTYNLQGLLAAQPSDEEIAKIRSMYNPWILSIKRITSGGQNELVFYDQDDNYYSSTILKPNELMTLKVNRPYFYDDFMR